MKILMVNKFLYPNGGSETYMLKLGQNLQLLGHEVQYFGMQDKRNIVGNKSNAYSANANFHSEAGGILEKAKLAMRTVYSSEARRQIRKVLEQFKPDVVHMNNINFQLTPAIFYEVKNFGIALVQTIHDVQFVCPNHRFYIEHTGKICEDCRNGSYWKCIKNKCLHGSTPKSILAAIESYYYHIRNTYNLVDLYICPSQFISEQIISGGIDPKRIQVMYNFSDKIDNIPKMECNKKYALYFGRLSAEKGVGTLLSVCKELSEIQFVFAGRGSLERELKSASETYPNIQFVGFKKAKELQGLIAGARFSIYPSEWYENCPLSVIESQALGTPVIGSDLGGTKELIDHEKTGLIFEGCNGKTLKNAILRLWKDEDLALQLRENCLNKQSNTIDTYSELLIDQYKITTDKVMNSGGKSCGKNGILAD